MEAGEAEVCTGMLVSIVVGSSCRKQALDLRT